MLGNTPKRLWRQKNSASQKPQTVPLLSSPMLPLSDAACSFITLDRENSPLSTSPFYAMSVICAAKIWGKHSAAPRGVFFFYWKDSNRSWNVSYAHLPPALKFIGNMIYFQAPADPMRGSCCLYLSIVLPGRGRLFSSHNAPVIKRTLGKGHWKKSSKQTLCRDVNP